MATIKERLSDELATVTKRRAQHDLAAADARLADTSTVLKAALTEISKAEVAGKTRIELDETQAEAVIRRLIKQRREAAAEYTKVGATARAEREMFEIGVLEAYVPKQLDEDETRILISGIIAERGLSGPRAIGSVMGALKGEQVDGATASRIARELLGA